MEEKEVKKEEPKKEESKKEAPKKPAAPKKEEKKAAPKKQPEAAEGDTVLFGKLPDRLTPCKIMDPATGYYGSEGVVIGEHADPKYWVVRITNAAGSMKVKCDAKLCAKI